MRETVTPPTTEPCATLSFASYESPLGPIYAAVEGPSLVAISFCQELGDFRNLLTRRFGPSVTLRPDTSAFKPFFRLLDSYFGGRIVDFFTLDIKVSGTAFDRSVWQAMREIPHGEVRSYGDVAKAVGRDRAFRAVAGACGRNMLPIVIPCHRVVCSDGSPGGWSGGGGLGVKEGLLGLEKASPLELEKVVKA